MNNIELKNKLKTDKKFKRLYDAYLSDYNYLTDKQVAEMIVKSYDNGVDIFPQMYEVYQMRQEIAKEVKEKDKQKMAEMKKFLDEYTKEHKDEVANVSDKDIAEAKRIFEEIMTPEYKEKLKYKL